jgi:peptide/nickel transport system permease protein
MRGVLIQQYILLARAKGLSELQLLVHHALRNALAPLISYGGLQFGMLLTGAVVTESLFGLQGIGLTVLRAVADRDLNVVKAGVVVAAFGFVFMNLMADVIHGLIDPRAMKMPAR